MDCVISEIPFCLTYVEVFACMYVFTKCVQSQGKGLGSLELELQVIVSSFVGAGY